MTSDPRFELTSFLRLDGAAAGDLSAPSQRPLVNPHVVLDVDMAKLALVALLRGTASGSQLVSWAEFVCERDDVDLDPPSASQLLELLEDILVPRPARGFGTVESEVWISRFDWRGGRR